MNTKACKTLQKASKWAVETRVGADDFQQAVNLQDGRYRAEYITFSRSGLA